MHITKILGTLVCCGSCVASSWALAHDQHEMVMPAGQETVSEAVMNPSVTGVPISQKMPASGQNKEKFIEHDHRREHGGQVYQATKWDNQWRTDQHGHGELSSEIETWVGTDENKLFIKAHVEKQESLEPDYIVSALYSRNIAEFWDVQTGMRYRSESLPQHREDNIDAALGLHGLAPYFFETQAYMYVGQNQHVSLGLETERDILLTQKLISQPYLKADLLLRDESDGAKKTGLSSLQAGIQTRYEINKKVMPFMDIGYRYEKGNRQTGRQAESASEKGWLYGAGITFKF